MQDDGGVAAVNGARALDEDEARLLLGAYGVPLASWSTASDVHAAAASAGRLGFPVALKGMVAGVVHKTEAGLVELGLADGTAVLEAFVRLEGRSGGRMRGALVERMVRGRREFVSGMFRDPQFGPVVMFELGGVLTEALDDVAFAVAPLLPGEAGQMLDSIRALRLLGAYRGEPPVDRGVLTGVLEGLSRLALDHPEVVEVDVNPLLVEGGRPVAVDALVMVASPGAEIAPPPVPAHVSVEALEALFAPRSVAVVGASSHPGKWGGSLLVNLVGEGFPGRLYPVNAHASQILGLPAYPSVSALPEAPDLVLVAVPGSSLVEVVEECGRKGVRALVVVSAGFAEHSEVGAAQEREAARVAAGYGMALLGPNTVGVISPSQGLCAMGSVPLRVQPGSAALMSQSGNVALQFMLAANRWKLGIGRFVGLGNEALVNAADLLEFFGDDPELDLVLAYLEGIRDGRRFLEVARGVAAKKPVVVLCGGTSVSGSRAAASHTGAMAGRSRVFAAAARQAGLTVTTDQDEFMDVAVAYSRMPLPPGRRVAVVTSGGGWGVMCADELERKGLTLARLPSALVGQLDEVLSQYWSRGNPVDLVATVGEGRVERALQLLVAADEVDAVVMLGVLSVMALEPRMRRKGASVCRGLGLEPVVAVEMKEARRLEEQLILKAGELMETYGKPVLAVDLARGSHVELREGGRHRLVVYPSPLRAVQALAHMARYAEHRRRGKSGAQ